MNERSAASTTLSKPALAGLSRSSGSKSAKRLSPAAEILERGGPGYLQFAITNICNARCDFCSFAVDRFDPKQRKSVTLRQAQDVVDIAAANHIGYLLFVGGEPLAHKDLREMVAYAAERGIKPMVCTNGSLWTETNVSALADAGLSSVIMSIDTHDPKVHEAHRGLPGVCEKIRRANAFFASRGIQCTASVTISKLVRDYDRLLAFVESLGFDSLTFSYPLNSLGSSYLSCSDSELIQYTDEELIEEFERIKRLKKRSRFPIVNPTASLADMQRHLRKEPERFGCLGGYKYFYLDWNLDLYRCHYWETPMCSIYEFDESKLIRDGCTRCMIDCYRDPSVLQFMAVRLSDFWKALRSGRLLKAGKLLADRRILLSLGAIWESRKYIRRV